MERVFGCKPRYEKAVANVVFPLHDVGCHAAAHQQIITCHDIGEGSDFFGRHVEKRMPLAYRQTRKKGRVSRIGDGINGAAGTAQRSHDQRIGCSESMTSKLSAVVVHQHMHVVHDILAERSARRHRHIPFCRYFHTHRCIVIDRSRVVIIDTRPDKASCQQTTPYVLRFLIAT